MSKKQIHYDVIIIGAGPAGYASALRCAQLGFKTACIDSWRNKQGQSRLGGSHLNAGCVASMTLLESAKIYHLLNHEIKKHGIHAENISVDIPQIIKRKDNIIEAISHKMADLFAHHKIDHIHANAKLLNAR